MNRSLKTIIIVLSVLGYVALTNIGARLLWTFANLGENLNVAYRATESSVVCGYTVTTHLYRCGYPSYNATQQFTPERTFWNYNTDWGSLIQGHLIASVAVGLIAFMVIGRVLDDHEDRRLAIEEEQRFNAAVEAEVERRLADDENDDDIIWCRDSSCSCSYHFDEKFDRGSGAWVDATSDEQADRYIRTVKTVS